jgi:hypothetical protein
MNLTSKKKGLLVLCACIILPFLAPAQTDFRKGFMITHERDTVFGLANFYDGIKAYDVCQFKRTDNEESKTYSPSDIVGYGFVGDRKYASKKIVQKEDSATFFLQVLAYGRITLYRYRETFWVEKEGSKLTELRDDMVDRVVDGQRYSSHSNEHVATLNMLMADCDKVRKSIQKIPLYQRQLVELVEAYNECWKVEVKDRVQKPWIKLIPGISGGVVQSTIDVNDLDVILGDDVVQGEKSVSSMFGVSLDVSVPRVSERFLFTTSLLYTSSQYYLTSELKRSYQQYIVIDIDALKLPFGIRYTFAPRLITPYLNAGFATIFHFDTSSSWTTESTVNNVVETFIRDPLPLKSTQLGYWAGIGFLTRLGKKFDAVVEFRYERTDGVVHMLSYVREYSSHVNNLQVLFGLRMNKVQ